MLFEMASASNQRQSEVELPEPYLPIRPGDRITAVVVKRMEGRAAKKISSGSLSSACSPSVQSQAVLIFGGAHYRQMSAHRGRAGPDQGVAEGVRFSKRKAEHVCQVRNTFQCHTSQSGMKDFDSAFWARE